MSGFEEIYLHNLSGNQLGIAKSVNSDNNEKLTGSEVSIFLMKCQAEGVPYETGKPLSQFDLNNFFKQVRGFIEKSKFSESRFGNYKIVSQDFGNKRIKVYDNVNGDKVDTKVETNIKKDSKGNVTVNYSRVQVSRGNNFLLQESSFTYNILDLENHIINKAFKKGHEITYFSEISKLRYTREELLTTEQKSLLKEFDNLLKYVVEIGTDYGVDPKQLIAIIQEEVEFDGLGKKRNVTDSSGKGYMQLTSSVINDILGLKPDGTYENYLKLDEFGVEVIELLESRGFDIQNATTDEQKRTLSEKVMDYLKKNQDADFNIRLGTLKLRKELSSANGDFAKAAFNYNGNPKIDKTTGRPVREGYRDRTLETYRELLKDCAGNSAYVYKKNIKKL